MISFSLFPEIAHSDVKLEPLLLSNNGPMVTTKKRVFERDDSHRAIRSGGFALHLTNLIEMSEIPARMLWGRFSMGLVMPQPKRFGHFIPPPIGRRPSPSCP